MPNFYISYQFNHNFTQERVLLIYQFVELVFQVNYFVYVSCDHSYVLPEYVLHWMELAVIGIAPGLLDFIISNYFRFVNNKKQMLVRRAKHELIIIMSFPCLLKILVINLMNRHTPEIPILFLLISDFWKGIELLLLGCFKVIMQTPHLSWSVAWCQLELWGTCQTTIHSNQILVD